MKAEDIIENATLEFLIDWQERQTGAIRAGGKLIIKYDPERLKHCRLNWRGAEVWDIEAFVKFHPGGQFFSGTVLEKISANDYGPVIRLEPKPLEVDVPRDAREVEMWFRNSHFVSSQCEAWDSRFGQNYWYSVHTV